MIFCDYCGEFYHFECVGVVKVTAIDTYKCNDCLRGGADNPEGKTTDVFRYNTMTSKLVKLATGTQLEVILNGFIEY